MACKLILLLAYDLVDIFTEVLVRQLLQIYKLISQLDMRTICQILLRAHRNRPAGKSGNHPVLQYSRH